MALSGKGRGTYLGLRACSRRGKPFRRLCCFYWMAPRPPAADKRETSVIQ